ncbi:MAG: UPF0262 family protein [Bauldia sp.]
MEQGKAEITGKLVAVTLDEASIVRTTPDIEHERAVAIYDLIEDNRFQPAGHAGALYRLHLGLVDRRLVLRISDDAGGEVVTHILSLTPLSRVVKDYFIVCDSYYAAIKNAAPSRIEAIDQGRRALHNEGSTLLKERLEGKIDVDFDTARRLFTLVCALHWRN